MKILITGVAGLLGSRLSDYIIENHPDVHIVGIDDMSGGYKQNVNPKVELWEMNLVNGNIDECFEKHQFDFVYHFAAYAAEGLSPFIRTYNYQNNLVATSRIITQSIKHNIKRLVFTSTLAVYGHQDGNMFDEIQVPKPIDPYGVAKYGCEMDIQIAGEQHGLDWCIIRPHNVYGVKQNVWDKYRNVLGIWMYQHTIKEPMTIFGDGTQTRAFSYIDDSLEPLWKASQDIRASKQIINLGGIKEYSINEANEILREVVGGGEVKYFEGRHEVKHSIPTWQKSIDLLDFEHKTDLKEGLTKMWEWVQTQPVRERFVWPFYELDKGIYSFWKQNK
jgi:UDP-glucose 4-epimerase